MIYFDDASEWDKFGQRYLSDPAITVIDLRDCTHEEEYVLKVEEQLHGLESCRLKTGRSLDALNDVLWDYFYEKWLMAPQIYIVGWGSFTKQYPIFSQRLLTAIESAYLTVIWGRARAGFEGDDKFEDLKIHEEIADGVKVYLFLN